MKNNFTKVASLLCSLILLFAATSNAQKSLINFWDFNQTRPFTGGGGDSLGTVYSYSHTLGQDSTLALTWPMYANYSTNGPGTAEILVKGHPTGANQSFIDNGSGGAYYYEYNSTQYNYYSGSDSNGSGGNIYVRARNPVKNDTVYMYLPTTGYQNIQLNYAISASSTKGANYSIFSYSTNGGATWNNLTTAMDTFNISGIYRPDTLQMLNPTTSGSHWYPVNMDFTSDASVNNNANFILRWVYAGPNVTQTSGNNRYDNFALTGDSLCPVISLQPANYTICGGSGNADFVIHSRGGTAVTYQWYLNTGSGFNLLSNGGIYSGATTDSLILTGAASAENGYQYECQVANTGCGILTGNPATLTVDPALNASISSTTDVTCTGQGSATSSVSGGTNPYTYLWNDLSHQATATASNLSAGNYTVTVTDAVGCSATTSATINQVGLALSIPSIINQECTAFGSATAVASNGTAPYTYNWTDGESTATATGLSAGTYTVTAMDITTCSASASVTILSVTPIRDSLIGTGKYTVIHYWDFNNTPPGGGAGGDSLGNITNPLPAPYTLIPGGNPRITYNHPSTIQTVPYVCTTLDGILDNFAPTAPAYAYVNDLPLLGNDSGGIAAGNLGVRARNPSENAYMYLYLPTTGYQNIQLNYALSASSSKGANYNVFSYSTDGGSTWKNLTTAMDTFNIGGIYRPDTMQAINPVTSVSNWYPVNINFSSDNSVNDNPNFIVRLEFEGPNTIMTSGNDRYDNISLSGNFLTETCNGASDYTAVAGIKYGQTPYTYSWTPNVSSSATASNLSAGSYTVDVTDANGCSMSSNITISQPTVVTGNISSVTNLACNAASDGAATATGNGGTGPYNYNWTGGGTTNTVSGLSAGSYTVTVTDIMGCVGTTSVSLTQPPALTLSANTTANEHCNGDAIGSASSTPSGGTGVYTYSWSGGGGANATASNLSAGTYTLTVTDANGCTTTASTIITQPAAIVAARYSVSTTAAGCSGIAAVTVTSGGVAPYTYLWSPGAATTDTIQGKCFGGYCCTITDNNGCRDSVCVIIDENTTGIADIGNSSTISIYPDPSSGSFTIAGVVQGQMIEVYNSLGQKLSSTPADKPTMYFDISNKTDGIYLIRILNIDGSLVTQKKIIKAH